MTFFGKEYTFDKQENFEDFVNALGIPETHAQGFLNFHPNQKLVQNGDSYTLINIIPGGNKETTFKSGVPFKETIVDRTCDTTSTVDGNTLTQVQKFDDGSEIRLVRVYSDSGLVVSITSSKYNGTARRYYNAV